ncbi:MAG: hypothetical protein KUG81_09045 [Gammaproteobacteria bacterium]|nr:hypothetical protein [Gammaproteobacteria bacterium]
MAVFGRRYELWILPSTKLVSISEVKPIVGPELIMTKTKYDASSGKLKDAVDWVSAPIDDEIVGASELIERITISELHVVANIAYEKEQSSSMDQEATIDIYNLSESNRNKIQESSLVILKAGYESDDSLALVFSGQLHYSYTEKSGSDIITHLSCKDSYTPIKDKRVSLSFTPGEFRVSDILQSLLNEAKKIGVASFLNIPRVSAETLVALRLNRVNQQGYVAEGNLFEHISKLCEQVGLTAYIQHSVLYVEPKAHHPKEVVSVVKVQSENVIGTISTLTDSSGSGEGSKKAPNGIKFKVFLDGRLRLIDYAEIVGDKRHQSLYEIKKVTHILDLEGTSWYTEVEARDLQVAE